MYPGECHNFVIIRNLQEWEVIDYATIAACIVAETVKWYNEPFRFAVHDARVCIANRIATTVESDRNSFSLSFSAPKMTGFDSFGQFRFRP